MIHKLVSTPDDVIPLLRELTAECHAAMEANDLRRLNTAIGLMADALVAAVARVDYNLPAAILLAAIATALERTSARSMPTTITAARMLLDSMESMQGSGVTAPGGEA